MLRFTLLPFVSMALLAQDPSPLTASATPTPPAQILASAPFHGVWIDPEPSRDGRFWCRGDRYKMSFGDDGARFVPLFSSRTPMHYPLGFHLVGAAAAAPERRGDGYVFRRGAIEERWDLKPEGAEQSFVLQQRPAGNALVIEVTTVLPFTGASAKGLHFLAEGWGEVVYGHAFAVGKDGGKTPLSTTFVAGAIRIELPADATYPLVVDPFVSTIGVASNEAFDNRNPAVAYEGTGHRWCVVMEERVSLLDTDIKVRRFDEAGLLIDTDYFESGGAIADEPAVAAAGPIQSGGFGSFYVVWCEQGVNIVGRLIDVTAPNPGPALSVYLADPVLGGFAQRPDVAGSPQGIFLVVYVEENVFLPPKIGYGRVSGQTISLHHDLLTTTGCITPKVADAFGANLHWAITWTRQASGCLGGDVHLAVLNLSLGVELPPTAIATAALDDDRHADVAWNGNQGLVVWDRDQGSHHDIFGQVFQRTVAGYALLGSNRNLTTLEPGITASLNQEKPAIATDGLRFAVAYMEGSTPKPICATFAIDNGVLECHEGHVPIATANLDHDDLGIAAMGTQGGPLTRYFVVTDERDGFNDYDVQGLFYDGRQTGAMFTTVATGCLPINAPEAQLTVSGSSDLGHSFVMTMTGHRALPFILVGFPQTPSLTLCTVLVQRQCRQGVQLPVMLSSFGSQLVVSVPRDVGLVGLPLAFQGVDLLATGACGASLFGSAFAVTDTIQAVIR